MSQVAIRLPSAREGRIRRNGGTSPPAPSAYYRTLRRDRDQLRGRKQPRQAGGDGGHDVAASRAQTVHANGVNRSGCRATRLQRKRLIDRQFAQPAICLDM
jgi:hypothetical protein